MRPEYMDPSEVMERLGEAGVRPSKRLGQHFLLREEVAHRMVENADIQAGETVLEVGPGLGILTNALLERTDRVVAVEVDSRLCSYLRRRFPKLDLLEGDVLRMDMPPFERVVSNLPYEISSPFTFRLLRTPFKRAVVTFQREFAQRMVAGHTSENYSRLSVKVQYQCAANILEVVPRSAFWPQPEVDSAVVQLDTSPPPFQVDKGKFHQVVDALFSQRRKKAMNALLLGRRQLGLSEESLRANLAENPLAALRAEEMSPEQIADLTNLLFPPKG